MATSSEWLAALAAPPEPAPPRWFEALGASQGFRPGTPFELDDEAATEPAPAPCPDPEPETSPPDPQAEALARAFAEGEAAGRAAAKADHAGELAHARALRLAFRALDEAALGVLAEELAATVEVLCRQVLGDYALDSTALAARCEAAAARLGGGWAGAVLHLNPVDAANLPEGALAGWNIATDPALDRGALLIEGSEGTVRDTPADWRRALAEALRA